MVVDEALMDGRVHRWKQVVLDIPERLVEFVQGIRSPGELTSGMTHAVYCLAVRAIVMRHICNDDTRCVDYRRARHRK